MKTAPTNWNNIVSGGDYKYECKLNVAGVDVFQSGIYKMEINGSAIGEKSASIGYAIAGEINVELRIVERDDPDADINGGTLIWTDGDSASGGIFWSGGDNEDGGTLIGIFIPKMAKLIPYIRVVDNASGDTSGWLKMGEYFIDTREKDVKNGKFSAHGYDAMLKAEQTYFPSVTSGSMKAHAIVDEIAALIGVNVNNNTWTALRQVQYDVPYYAGQYTAREMLGYIAAAYYGSFIINDSNELSLIRLTTVGSNFDIGAKAKGFEVSEEALTYDKIVIVIDPQEEITAGTGDKVLEFDCPFGTQAMANTILSALSNYSYRGYKVDTAVISPLYELGDRVTVKGNTSQIFKRTLHFNVLMASTLEAPYSEEIQHEFIYKRAEERKIERLAANTQSEFSIMANQISSKVSQTDYNGNEIASLINQNATTIAIQASKINLNGAVTANDYFKILNDGTFQANKGEIGDLVLENGVLTATMRFPHTYTSADVTAAYQFATTSSTPTAEDYELYDIDEDGYIDYADYLKIANAVNNNDGIISYIVKIDPTDQHKTISLTLGDSTSDPSIYLGLNRARIGVLGTSNIEYAGRKIVDIVSEQGVQVDVSTSPETVLWSYRIWLDGTKECWYRKSGTVSMSAWGSGYCSPQQLLPNYPFTFTKYPKVVMTAQVANGAGWVVPNYTDYSTTNAGSFYIASFESGSKNYTVNVYAIGDSENTPL